jgi:hypothetical protein
MQRPMRLAAVAATLAAAGALGVPGAPAQTDASITPKAVGALKLGMRFERARELGLVGKARRGCDLDPTSRYARLSSPLKGTVDLTGDAPRRIARISIRGGATARGVGVGDPLDALEAAFPSAEVNTRRVPTFGFWFVRVRERDGGPLEFTVETTGDNEVFQIDLPRYGFCE